MEYCAFVKLPVLYMKEYGTDRVEGVFSTIHQNYYTQLWELDDEHTKMKIAAL